MRIKFPRWIQKIWFGFMAFPERNTTYGRSVYENGQLVTDPKRADEIVQQMDQHWRDFDNRMKGSRL